jgi:3-hydroxyacyl-[acyl-carrier-protein] dehydratase
MINNQKCLSFDIIGIQACQRNRYPLLLIDRIVKVWPGHQATGQKCFSYNEWYFPAHFDDEPNVPGFIQIECLVQTFIMTFLCMPEYKGMKTNFANIDNVRFRRKVIPGDTLIINATLDSLKRGIAKGSAESFVGSEFVCSADFVITIPDVFQNYKSPKATI